MKFEGTRRQFLSRLGALAVATTAARPAFGLFKQLSINPVRYSPTDLTHSGTPDASAAADIRVGYAAITWGDQERHAVEDISALGYRGIQLRATAVSNFQPSELRDLLQQHRLVFVALSSGEINIDPAVEAQEIAKHVANAKFVRDAGGLYLQMLDQLKPWPRKVTPAECRRLGQLLTELGKRTADLGIPLGYHNHMNTIGEHPECVEQIFSAADARCVKLLLDDAHYLAGGGDPVKAIDQYRDRLLFVHLKDMVDEAITPENKLKYPERFVELGQGRVNTAATVAALRKIGFRGWALVELDRVPVKSRTPKESAIISRQYLQEKLGLTI